MYYCSIHRRGFLAKEAILGTNPKLNASLLDKINPKLEYQRAMAKKTLLEQQAAAEGSLP